MNIIDIQDQLKNFSEDQLINEMQMPSGNAPQFLVLSEIQRRKRVRDDFSKRKAAQQPTVAEEAIAAAGVPQSGIAGMSEAMAPKSTMVQNAVGSAMPEAMRSGGLMQFGNDIQKRISSQEVDPFLDEVEDMAESRFGVDFNESPIFGLNIDQRARPALLTTNDQMNYIDPPFERESRRMPVKGGPSVLQPSLFRNYLTSGPAIAFEEGGLVGALFSKTDHGKKLSSNQFEVRKGKDGRRMVYKKGTNIFVGTADKVFDEKYDGGLIRAQDGIPRGLRLNNPGNIRPGAGFFGEIGDDGGYAKFDSDAAGIRAIQRLLRTYGNQYGINTLRGLANRYAPPSDNNPTDNYIEFLSQQTGIDPDEPINLAERGSEIIPAIIGFEQGQQPFSQDMIDNAIGAAELDDEEAIANALFPQELIDAGVSPSDLAQADQSPGLMSAMAATSGSSPTPQQDYLAGQLSGESDESVTDAEGRRRRQAPDPNKPPTVLEPGDATKGRNVGRGGDPRDKEIKAAQEVAQDRAVSRAIETGNVTGSDSARADADLSSERIEDGATTSGNVSFETPQATGTSSLESEILKLQQQMQKDRETDKWLAIAQAGLALMSSDNPTLLGAAGEAGLEGLKAFRESNERYQEGVVDLINARAKLVKDGKITGITPSSAVSRVNKIEEILNQTDPTAIPLPPETRQILEEERRYLMRDILKYPEITA